MTEAVAPCMTPRLPVMLVIRMEIFISAEVAGLLN